MISLTGKTARLITQLEGCLTEYPHTHARTHTHTHTHTPVILMQLRLVPTFTFSLTLTDTGDFLRMRLFTPLCPDYTVFSNLALLCSKLIHSTLSLSSAIHLSLPISKMEEKKRMNILLAQFYLKQINAGLDINATYLRSQTKSLGAQMCTRVQNAPTQLDMLSHFACTHYTTDTHTHTHTHTI